MTAEPRRRSCVIPGSGTAPAAARHFVHDSLDGLDQPDSLMRAAEQLVSEVVTDSLRQEPNALAVTVDASPDGGVHVEVAHESSAARDETPSLQRIIARRCLDAYATRWNCDLDRTRTSTWFELAVAP